MSTKLDTALVTGRGRQAGTKEIYMIAVKGKVTITRSRVIVNDGKSYTIFTNDSAQILRG